MRMTKAFKTDYANLILYTKHAKPPQVAGRKMKCLLGCIARCDPGVDEMVSSWGLMNLLDPAWVQQSEEILGRPQYSLAEMQAETLIYAVRCGLLHRIRKK